MKIEDCKIGMTIIGAQYADNHYVYTCTGAICQIKEVMKSFITVDLIHPVSGHVPKKYNNYTVDPAHFDIYNEVKIEIDW